MVMCFCSRNSTVNLAVWEEASSWWSISHLVKNFWKILSDIPDSYNCFLPLQLDSFNQSSTSEVNGIQMASKIHSSLLILVETSKKSMYISSPVLILETRWCPPSLGRFRIIFCNYVCQKFLFGNSDTIWIIFSNRFLQL